MQLNDVKKVVVRDRTHRFPAHELSTGLILRPLAITDYERGLCETLEQLTMVGKVSRQQFKERFVQWTSEFDTYYIFVVEDTHKRKIVGVATLFVEKKLTHECGKVGHIEDVVVRSEYRGKKIGVALIEQLKQVGETVGCYKIILDCSEKNIPFYQRCGMKKKEIQMAFYIPQNSQAKL